MPGIDPLALVAAAPPSAASPATVFVAPITAPPAALEALLVLKLLDAVVTAAPESGRLVADTPFGPIVLATPLDLPEATPLQLRPAAEPSRAIVTVLAPRGAAVPAAASPAAAPAVAVAVNPVVLARILAAAPPQPGAAPPPPGAVLALEIVAVTPAEPPAPGAAPQGEAPSALAAATALPQPDALAAPTALPQPDAPETAPLAVPAGIVASPATAPPAGRTAAAAEPRAPEGEPAAATAAPPDSPPSTPIQPRTGAGRPLPPFSGTVIATSPSETIIDSPIGRLSLPATLGAGPGARLVFTLLRTIDAPAADGLPPAAPKPTAAELASRLAATLATALATAPESAATASAALQARAAPQLLAAILLFAAAARGHLPDPLQSLATTLAGAGHPSLAAALATGAAGLRDLAGDARASPFQLLLVPLMEGSAARPLAVYLPVEDDARRGPADEEAARFALEVELTRLGALQLDGLVRARRFDLALRSRRALPTALRAEIAEVFHDSLAAAGLTGDISFAVSATFPVGMKAAWQPIALRV
jgi:hypothetical protein